MGASANADRATAASHEARSGLHHSVGIPSAASYKAQRYDADSTRILCNGGWVVAMIERLSNGRWAICVGDQRYTNRTFSGVRAAFTFWQERQSASGMSAGTAETQSGSGLQPASPIAESETPTTDRPATQKRGE